MKVRKLNGYRVVYEPECPHAMKSENWKGWVYEHILVATKSLGRDLRSNEIVHHLDNDQENNAVENLLVLERPQHTRLHEWIKRGAPYRKRDGMQGLNSGKATVVKPRHCKACGRTLSHQQESYCSVSCQHRDTRKVPRPTREDLERAIDNGLNWSALGRQYGVSNTCVRKWAKQYGLLS